MAFVETWTLPTGVDLGIRRRLTVMTDWLIARWLALVSCTAVLAGVGFVHAFNEANWPTLANDDEGTYMARAWAVMTGRGAHHSLANYTYWYDHAPLGWIQLAPLAWLTRAFRAGGVADVTGRQIMLGYALVSTLLVYVIARRLGTSRLAALAAMAIFGLSPLSVDYLRQIFLDCIGLPWVLAAFALALSPRRNLWAFAASGMCFAVACLSKETFLLWFPALVWQVWRRTDREHRAMCLAAFSSVALGVLAIYPLYAALKGELLPAKGHVSLIGAVEWQLASRSSSGSVLAAGSGAQAKVLGWYHNDPFLLAGGVVALPCAAAFRKLRPLALGLIVPIAYILHPGYLPAMFIIGTLPFAALTIACAADALWQLDPIGGVCRFASHAASAFRRGRRETARRAGAQLAWRVGLAVGIAVTAFYTTTSWARADHDAMTYSVNAPLWSAESWVEQHVPRSDTVVVDENVWIDLVDDGYSPAKTVAFWELSADPDVVRRYPDGWRQMDYIVVSNAVRVNAASGSSDLVSVATAIAHSVQVTQFGSGSNAVQIRKVQPNSQARVPAWLPASILALKSSPND